MDEQDSGSCPASLRHVAESAPRTCAGSPDARPNGLKSKWEGNRVTEGVFGRLSRNLAKLGQGVPSRSIEAVPQHGAGGSAGA